MCGKREAGEHLHRGHYDSLGKEAQARPEAEAGRCVQILSTLYRQSHKDRQRESTQDVKERATSRE